MGSGSELSCPITLNTVLTSEQQDLYQNEKVILSILAGCKSVAIIGLSTDTQRASYFTASYLQANGYRIIPVNPKGGTILGERVYESLLSIPDPVDLVDVFRPAHEALALAREAIAKKVKAFWLQLKIIDFKAAELVRQAGIDVVMDRCVKMEYGRYHGGLHEAGMNTEIISARRALTK